MRVINVAAAQMGPIQKADSREAVVRRMIALMDEAKAKGADLIIYPELALTTFFPRWYMEDQAEVDRWFEREMPNAAVRPLFERAARYQMAMSFGYAELTPDGHHGTRLPASRKTLFRARRSRLQCLAGARRHLRHGGVQ
jgi:predicted amidohydrolase